jgi:alcohol dehydrogenase (cytochrome c)
LYASTPVVVDGVVYVQDLRSNVYALDRDTGELRWSKLYHAGNDGPNGVAVGDGRVYGSTDTDVFALDAGDGHELWRKHMTKPTEQFLNVAPVFWKGLVFTSSVGYPRGGRGAIYAFDAKSGSIRWRFDTIKDPWPGGYPHQAGGGGLWNPVSIDADGRLYAGNSNPSPWGGSPELPNGAAFPGPALYTDSLLVLDARTGKLLWYDQVTPHDVRDYDFQASPVIVGDLVVGAGKAGRVIAWNRATHHRVWSATVGKHLNDVGPLPRRWVTVCPGLLGGVETQLASAGGRVFAAVVDLCVRGSAIDRVHVTDLDPTKGRGRLVALDADTGDVLWQRFFPSPAFGCATVANDVVFTSTYDGAVYGLDVRTGRTVWRTQMRAGINSCPAISGDLLLLGAGVPYGADPLPELVAFGT